VVEELLSGVSRPTQLCGSYNIAVSLLYHWKKQYGLGKLNNEPVKEAAMRDKIEKLERMVGKLAMEKELIIRLKYCLILGIISPYTHY